MDKRKNNYMLPPRFSMDEYMDAVEFLIDLKNTSHIQKQKTIEKSIQTPFTFNHKPQRETQKIFTSTP